MREGPPGAALLLAAAAAALLAGCGAARPEVVTATSSRVSYSWDTEASNLGEVTGLAQAHCGEFGKNASLVSTSPASGSGTFLVTVYDCVLP